MKFRIYSDCHKNGVAEKKGVKFWYNDKTIFLGDVHEIKNISKKKVKECIAEYHKHINKCRSFGSTEIRGNHEVNQSLGLDFKIINGVLFTHGHHIFYSRKDVKKWESRRPGRGVIGRAISKMIHLARGLRSMKEFDSGDLMKIANYIFKMLSKGLRFHTIVIGHTHPDNIIEYDINVYYDGENQVKIYNVMQGYTELNINIPEGY